MVKLKKKRGDVPDMSHYPDMRTRDDTFMHEKYELAKDS